MSNEAKWGCTDSLFEREEIAPIVLMLGTDPSMRGGIASVVAAIRDEGFFDWAHVRYIATHVDGGAVRKALRFASALAMTVGVLATRRVVIAHAHVSSNASLWRKATLLWISRRLGVSTIFHLHSGGFADYAAQGGALRRWCIRRTLESSSMVVVLSERWAAWVHGFAPAARVRIVGNPVRIPPNAPPPSIGKDNVLGRVLYLGLICEAKGSFDLLRAWAAFRGTVPGWRLVIGGNGEVDRFLADAERLGVRQDIDYLGWVSGDAKERALASADVFVLPSYKEGMPVSILEAMANNVAVVATPVGGVPDMMVPEQHGLIVAPGDVVGLEQAMSRLAESPNLRARLTADARAHVLQRYASSTVIEQLKSVYREVRSSSRSP